ncbi:MULTISPECIES: LrgB family protein [unclassified Oceanobacter]|uniref:LrgB family protein n=1 Tax=unclassified Oceanobacter TaxID=2620260 RepID=UPI0026E180B1|nr:MULTISPECIES: LrgB family protein [unclassified Oceanobacter]MDO6680735.1 LrgB family protein [Oceanobacter sp. 5_MG-2023]MDP2504503.1 LrgB family protein [Oceanobacter sp. 3_MG-2023]MDP2547043.1 LrgB family protein [Oceanobacter sp. 4_MG-2023]MDP2607867.1 LrgB family protein [Oceanobacter sp. 1_MG-2023]MDP2610949.1 LrgB family protein [Oceanobacter sp. 2_MG-2023]
MMILLQTPLFWTALTIGAFLLGQQVYRLTGNLVLLPPILTGIGLVVVTLKLTDTPYTTYMEGGHYLHDMLQPLIVMLAVPLFLQLRALRQDALRIALAVTLGSATTVACAWWLTSWWIGDPMLSQTMLTKSITTPVAVAITGQLGGDPSLAAAFVILSGLLGVIMILPILTLMRIQRPETVGITLGVCAHAIGTSRALDLGEREAAYAITAMILTATLHAVVLPLLVSLF